MYEPAIKAEVRRLRREGYTLKEIKEKFPFLSKSTISNWTKDILLTLDQQKRILEKILKGRLRFIKYNKQRHFNAIKKSQRVISKAKKEIGKLTKRDLKLIGTALYWAEGYKKGKDQIEFTNSDPKIIVLMMRFFREILTIREEKFRLSLILHPGLDEKEIKEFWSSLTGIPLSQFNKSYIKAPKSSTRKMHNPLYKGTLRIRISDTEKLHRLKGFIKGLSENI
jgi:hypothetical protein